MVLKRINRYLKENYGVGIIKMNMKRGALNFAKNYFKEKKIMVAEIGTYKGINAKQILKNLNVRSLYVIDLWDNYPGYNGYNNKSSKKVYDSAIKLLKKEVESGKVIIIRDNSENAYNILKNKKFDFIYIDGNHDYNYVKKDVFSFWSLLKNGGILGGHDIDFTGVLQVVSEFSAKYKLKLNAESKDWWIIKGEN